MDNLESKISPELHIQMTFEIEPPKKCRSCNNSPNTNFDSSVTGFPWNDPKSPDLTPNPRTLPEIAQNNHQKKIKALEEIGLFSEFSLSKPITDYSDSGERQRRSAINITDFMINNNKMVILQNAGGMDAYFSKRKEYQKELMLKDSNLQQFFHHSEKKPKFFTTPPLSPRFLPKCGGAKEESRTIKRASYLDSIMEKCDEAIGIKPKFKSNSPRMPESETLQPLKKRLVLSKNK